MRSHHQALDLSCDDPSYPTRDLQQSCWGATVNCKFVSTDHTQCVVVFSPHDGPGTLCKTNQSKKVNQINFVHKMVEKGRW